MGSNRSGGFDALLLCHVGVSEGVVSGSVVAESDCYLPLSYSGVFISLLTLHSADEMSPLAMIDFVLCSYL